MNIDSQRKKALELAQHLSQESGELYFALEIFDDIGYSVEVYSQNEIPEKLKQNWNYVE